MFTRITYPGVTITAVSAIAAALLQCGAAAADPGQDDQFLTVLANKQIPAMENVATVVAAGHTVCRKLDDGMPAPAVLDGLTNDAYTLNPDLHRQAVRLSVTMSRFIEAAVEVYCPGDQGKIASLAASRSRRSDQSTHPVVTVSHHRATARGAALAAPVGGIATGDAPQPKPPKIPPPKVPEAKIPRTPRAVTTPPPRQLPPPPPVETPPPPPQNPPPAPEGPQPGIAGGGNGGDGSGAGGGNGDAGGPAAPPAAPPQAPGMIRLVPW